MKPLAINQEVLQWISALPAEEEKSNLKRFIFKFLPLFIICGNITGGTSSIVFFCKFVSVDLEESLYALFQIAGHLNMSNTIISTIFSLEKIQTMFKNLEIIYNANANDESFKYMARANIKAEKIFRAYTKLVIIISPANLTLMPANSVLICWLETGGFDPKLVYRPFKHLLPWDQNTPLGYFGELMFDLMASVTYMFVSGSLFVNFISVCLFHPAFYETFEHSVRKLGHGKGRNDSKQLRDLIQFHMSVKSWFAETTDLFSPYFVVQLISFMIFLACNAFQLDMLCSHLDMSITMLLPTAAVTILSLFFFCFFAKSGTESFLKMGDCLYDSNWQELPVRYQKYLIPIIQNTQEPIYYTGYGIAYLNLETFAKCFKTIITYYMAFKTLTTT